MLSSDLRAQIRHWFYAEHSKVGTIAQQLGLQPPCFKKFWISCPWLRFDRVLLRTRRCWEARHAEMQQELERVRDIAEAWFSLPKEERQAH